MKKINNLLFTIVIIFFLSFVIYSYRSIFLTPYDNNYYRDLYDHSQWNIPRSKRTVGDNIVYKVAGYDLVKTWDYFTIDPQTPVLGKYIFGYSILTFKNAEIASLILFIFTGLLFYLLSNIIFKNKFLSQVSLLIFITEPIIFYQSSQSMLDLSQLFFLIIHIISVIALTRSKKSKSIFLWSFLSGLSLGGFISLKIGFYSAAIILGDFIYLLRKKRLINLIYILLISGLTYIASYFPYFLRGHSIVDFIKAQKWIIFSYWLQSKSKPVIGMVFLSLFTGLLKGWTKESAWERVKEWTILWPVYGYILINKYVTKIKKLNDESFYLLSIVFGLILLYTITPFSPRYLVLVIPLLIILSINYLVKINRVLIIFITLIYVFQVIMFLRPTPTDSLISIKQVWNVSAYQDLYDFIDRETKKKISRYDFWRSGQTFERDLGVRNKEIQIIAKNTFFWENSKPCELRIVYFTSLGKITNSQKLLLIRENNSWKISWEDEYLLSGYSFKDKILSNFIEGKYGKLISKNGEIRTEAVMWPIFFITPEKIIDESLVIKQLSELTGIKKHDMEYSYKANWQWNWPAEIGPLKYDLSPEILDDYKLDRSISIEHRPVRIMNFEYLALYPQLDPILGGTIILEKKDGSKQTIIKRDKVDGQDIIYEKDNSVR